MMVTNSCLRSSCWGKHNCCSSISGHTAVNCTVSRYLHNKIHHAFNKPICVPPGAFDHILLPSHFSFCHLLCIWHGVHHPLLQAGVPTADLFPLSSISSLSANATLCTCTPLFLTSCKELERKQLNCFWTTEHTVVCHLTNVWPLFSVEIP